MEHIIFHFIMDHLERRNIINNHQHGFWPAHSCQNQLLSLTKDVLKAADNRKQVDLVFLDFVRPLIRCLTNDSLTSLKIWGDLLNWIEQWLTIRNQRVILENHISNKLYVKSGVPQGTALGLLMFLLYIDHNVTFTIRLFADDCIIY